MKFVFLGKDKFKVCHTQAFFSSIFNFDFLSKHF